MGFGNFISSQLVHVLISWTFVGTVTSTLIAFIIWVYVLSHVQITLVYPMVSFSYIIMTFLGAILFKETLTLNKVIGVAVICTGVFVLSLDRNW